MGGSWEKRCDMGIDKCAGGGIAYHQSGIRMPTCVQCMNDQNPITSTELLRMVYVLHDISASILLVPIGANGLRMWLHRAVSSVSLS